MNDRGTHVFTDPFDEGPVSRPGMADRRLDIWHCRTHDGRRNWQPLKRIWKGYTGALNSSIQLRNGRLVLPFSCLTPRSWKDRGDGLDAFWYVGQLFSTVVFSDDGGDTWEQSSSQLKVHTPSIGLYGACEPVVLELLDGRVWMLIRTQLGRLYESFSDDGSDWSHSRPTKLISSDSPVGLVRLADDRVVLLWNKCLRFPYAHGGRHVLHAAISEDDGQTWIGHREVARDPLRHQPPPPGGDFGTAYPFPAVMADGRVIVTTGQGKGRIAIVVIDPDWLYGTRQEENFATDLEQWSVFGCRGVELQAHPERQGAQVLSIARTDDQWPAAAVWNFPAGARGTLRLRLCLQEGSSGAQLMLADHFSVPFEPEDVLNASFTVTIAPTGELSGGSRLEIGKWCRLQLEWDVGRRLCELSLDGDAIGTLPLLRDSEGVCYLRLKSAATGTETGGLLVEHVDVEISSTRAH